MGNGSLMGKEMARELRLSTSFDTVVLTINIKSQADKFMR